MTHPDTLDITADALQPGDVVLGYIDDGEFHPMLRGFYRVASFTTTNGVIVVTEPRPGPDGGSEHNLEPDRGVRIAARDPLTRAAARLQSGLVRLEFALASGRRAAARRDHDAAQHAGQRRDAAFDAQRAAIGDYIAAGGTLDEARMHALRFAYPETLASP